jgi:hypothetical protein
MPDTVEVAYRKLLSHSLDVQSSNPCEARDDHQLVLMWTDGQGIYPKGVYGTMTYWEHHHAD